MSRLNRVALSCAFAIGLFAHVGFGQDAETEQAVIEAALRAHVITRPALRQPILMSSLTSVGAEAPLYEAYDHAQGTIVPSPVRGPVRDDILADYQSRNREALTITKPLPSNFIAVDLAAFRSQDGFDWERLSAAYPEARGIVEIGRPGFRSDGKCAVIRIDVSPKHGHSVSWISTLCDAGVNSWKVVSGVSHPDRLAQKSRPN